MDTMGMVEVLGSIIYGHYHTVRRPASDPKQWVGVGYSHNADGWVFPYYLRLIGERLYNVDYSVEYTLYM